MGKEKLMQLAFTLLQGGVAYKHVKRFISEVRDHHEDLEQEALSNGSDAGIARDEAAEKLGDAEILAQEMLGRPELKSLGYRYPKTILVIGPVLSTIILSVMMVFFVIGVISIFNLAFKGDELADQIVALPYWLIVGLDGIRLFWMYLLPILVVILFVAYAEKNLLSMKYYGAGVLIASFLACSQYVNLIWPDPVNAVQGSFNVSLYLTEVNFLTTNFLRLASCLIFAFGTKYYISKTVKNDLAV
jgi:uncharacterized membrane protein